MQTENLRICTPRWTAAHAATSPEAEVRGHVNALSGHSLSFRRVGSDEQAPLSICSCRNEDERIRPDPSMAAVSSECNYTTVTLIIRLSLGLLLNITTFSLKVPCVLYTGTSILSRPGIIVYLNIIHKCTL